MSVKKGTALTVLLIIVALAVFLSIPTIIDIRLFRVAGNAMSPTLTPGNRILVDLNTNTLNRTDIVVFRYPNDQSKIFVMRIIGLPGEDVEIRNGLVLIGG